MRTPHRLTFGFVVFLFGFLAAVTARGQQFDRPVIMAITEGDFDEIEKLVAEVATDWGLADVDVRLTDARLDESLMRAMMRETEAQKEASASGIRAEADMKVAKIYAEAARTLSASPGALSLRMLQSMTDMSNSKSTIVIPIPWELFPEGKPKTGVSKIQNPDS